MVCITPRANVVEMIETARKVADRFHGELIVVYVKQVDISEADSSALEEKISFAKSAGGQIEILDEGDPVAAILSLAKLRGVTQLFIGHTQRSKRWPWRDPVDKLIRQSHGMDVRIFPQ